jgi:ankyrin repeat protein
MTDACRFGYENEWDFILSQLWTDVDGVSPSQKPYQDALEAYLSITDLPESPDQFHTLFEPGDGQWEPNDENIKRIDPQTVKNILQINHDNFKILDNTGYPPIHYALLHFPQDDELTTLKYLLDQFNVNEQDPKGRTIIAILSTSISWYICQCNNK